VYAIELDKWGGGPPLEQLSSKQFSGRSSLRIDTFSNVNLIGKSIQNGI
jgi:hypothetical protein